MAEPHVVDVIAMVHVASVERSIAFYKKLGFEVKNSISPEGFIAWAFLRHQEARIMLTRDDELEDGPKPAVVFYHYTNDLVSLRQQLIDSGEKVSDITYPIYMPDGEVCMNDPDGYCLLIGQYDLPKDKPA